MTASPYAIRSRPRYGQGAGTKARLAYRDQRKTVCRTKITFCVHGLISPALANLRAFNLDVRVHARTDAFGVTNTRYADDLWFSGSAERARRSCAFEAQVAAIALDEGYRINHRKTCVTCAVARQRVTGIVVNGVPNLPREHYDWCKATLHNCLRQGPASQCAGSSNLLKHHRLGTSRIGLRSIRCAVHA